MIREGKGIDLPDDIPRPRQPIVDVKVISSFEYELNTLQEEVHNWRNDNFPISNDTEMLLGVTEELGELAHAHLKQMQNIRVNENHNANIKDAIGDIVIFLMGYCSYRHLSLGACIIEAWLEVKDRNWKKNREIGK